jgi:hypothetical protein
MQGNSAWQVLFAHKAKFAVGRAVAVLKLGAIAAKRAGNLPWGRDAARRLR